MTEQQPNNWYKNLISKLNSMSEQFELDELQSNDLRDFVVTLAKEQYRIGNKSGAAWAFKQAGVTRTTSA